MSETVIYRSSLVSNNLSPSIASSIASSVLKLEEEKAWEKSYCMANNMGFIIFILGS